MADSADVSSATIFTLITQFFVGIIANILVLLVFYRKPGLLTIANRFVVNLTIINVVACVTLLPITLAQTFNDLFTGYEHFFCPLADFVGLFCSSLIPLSVLLIAVDQYCAVVDPLRYHWLISNSRSIWMIASNWILPSLISLLGASLLHICMQDWSLSLNCAAKTSLHPVSINITRIAEEPTSLRDISLGITYTAVFAFVFLFIPLILICFIYLKICAAASQNTKRTIRPGNPAKDDPQASIDNSPQLKTKTPRPSLIVTRPSPPRSSNGSSCSSMMNVILEEQPSTRIKAIESLPNLQEETIKTECEALLKPPLKRNVSFSKISENTLEDRRYSNVSEFDLIIKPRSPSIQSETSSRSSSTVSRASSFLVSNLRHRISNASLFRYREEARAARISALVLVMALVCWLPWFVNLNLLSISTIFPVIRPSPQLNIISSILLLISTSASPALFAFRNRKVRKELRKVFCLNSNDLSVCENRVDNFLLRLKSQAATWVFSKSNPSDV